MNIYIAEFIGTFILMVFGLGLVASTLLAKSKGENAGWSLITIGWGIAVSLGVFVAGPFSGAHLNPAVTLSLTLIGEFQKQHLFYYLLAQFLGALFAAFVVYLHYLPHWSLTKNKDLKLAVFCTAPAVRHPWANFLSESIATFLLVFVILFLGAQKYAEGLGPIIVGLLVVCIGMGFGGPTGFAINPARDLAPRLAHFLLPIPDKGPSDWSYAWIPVVAPLYGGSLAALTYKALKTGGYELSLFVLYALFIFISLKASKRRLESHEERPEGPLEASANKY